MTENNEYYPIPVSPRPVIVITPQQRRNSAEVAIMRIAAVIAEGTLPRNTRSFRRSSSAE